MGTQERNVTFLDILKFYIPLAATSILMMVTHSVVSGAVARTAAPTISLAAYAAAYSVGQVFESPCYGLQRMSLTFTSGKRSFAVVVRVGLLMLGLILVLLSLIAWTPLSRVVFQGILGLNDEVYAFAVPSLRVFLLWPTSSAIRSFYQSIIVLRKKTYWMTVNMAVRVSFMFAAAVILPKVWPTGPVGASILMIGLSTEALLAFIVAKIALKPLEEEDSAEGVPLPLNVLKFTIPLAIAASVQTLGRPFVTASLSRTPNPEVTLAGYQVALSFSYIFAALAFNIYHAVIIFVKDHSTFRRVRAFSIGLGMLAASLLVVCSIPAVGNWVFGTIIGTDEKTTAEAVRTLSILAATPFLFAVAELYGGILLLKKRTVWVTAAKIVNVGVTSVVVLLLARTFPSMGGMIGALALSFGSLAEICISYVTSRSIADCRAIVKGQPTAQSSADV